MNSLFIVLLLLLFIKLFLVSLGIGVGIKKINDGRDLARIVDKSILDGDQPLLHPIQGDVEIDEQRENKREGDDGQQRADE